MTEGNSLEECLAQAQAAYEANDSKSVREQCDRALELDPDNATAWDLLAKFGGWDSKMYTLDMDYAIEASRRALALVPEDERSNAAAEIYNARKRQIAYILESEMTMPSHTSAKQLQGTMMDWKRLLEDIPYLTSTLIEGEVTLCENLCQRSRFSIMPGDRLINTAYTTFNHKEPYGETFRKALAARQRKEQLHKDEALQDAAALVEECRAMREALAGTPEERATLEEMSRKLNAMLERLAGISDSGIYESQLKEMERARASLKPYKVFKLREIDSRISEVRAKLEQIQAEDAATAAPLRDELAAIESLSQ